MRRKDQKKYSKDFVYFLHFSLEMIDYFQFSFIYSTPSLKKKLQFFQTFFSLIHKLFVNFLFQST